MLINTFCSTGREKTAIIPRLRASSKSLLSPQTTSMPWKPSVFINVFIVKLTEKCICIYIYVLCVNTSMSTLHMISSFWVLQCSRRAYWLTSCMTKRYVPRVSLPLDPPHLTRKLATITPNSYNKFTNIKQSKINNNDSSNSQTSTSVMYDSPCSSAFSTAASNTAQRTQASEVCLGLGKTERPKGPDAIS